MACLAFPPPSSSFLLSFFLLWFFFGSVLDFWVCEVCEAESLRGKERNKAWLFSFSKIHSFSLSCYLGRELWLGGGGVCFISFSFCKSCFNLQCTINAHHFLFPSFAKTMCKMVVFLGHWERMLAGHLLVFWLPWEANQASQGSLLQS